MLLLLPLTTLFDEDGRGWMCHGADLDRSFAMRDMDADVLALREMLLGQSRPAADCRLPVLGAGEGGGRREMETKKGRLSAVQGYYPVGSIDPVSYWRLAR